MDNSANKRIAKNTLFLYIRMGVVMFVALYSTRLVLQLLGTVDYGIYNVVCGFVAMFGVFNTCFSATISRFYNIELGKKYNSRIAVVFSTSIFIQLVLAIIVTLILGFIGGWYINNVMVLPLERLSTARSIFHFAMISMFITIIQAPYSAAVIAYERMDYYAFVSVLDAILKLIFIIFLRYINGDKLLLYGALICLIQFINYLLYFTYCRLKLSDLRLYKGLDRRTLKDMLSYAGWSTLDPIAYITRDQGSNMVLNSFFGPLVNAAHGIAYQISTAVENFSGSFSISFRPQIIQSYSEGNYGRTKNLIISMTKITYMMNVMLAIPIILNVTYILNLWLGDSYPTNVPVFASLILCVKCIDSLNAPISTVMAATGKIRIIKIYSAAVLCSVVPLSILLFKFNLPAYLTYCLMFILSIVNQIGCVRILQSYFPYVKTSEYLKEIIVPLLFYTILVSILPLGIKYILSPSFVRLILICIVSAIGATLIGYNLVMNISEKQMFKYFLLKIIEKFSNKNLLCS